jgi:hypothetical protein
MRIVKLFLWLLAALLLVGIVVAWTFPADVAWRYVAPRVPLLQLQGVSGTVWQGRAGNATAFGRPLGAIEWTIPRMPLLARRVVADVALRGGEIEATGSVVRASDGTVRVVGMHFRLPAELAQPALDIPSLRLVGNVEGTIDEATVIGGWVCGARGSARWIDAGVSGAAEARFGALLADFASQSDGSIGGRVRDDGSSNLAVDGQFVVRSGQFDANAQLLARNDDPQVREALRYIGEPQLDGSSLLKIHGQLFKLF